MTRYEDWPQRLGAFLDNAGTHIFQPGLWDCVLFTCAGVEAITGVDHSEVWAGFYSNRDEAEELLQIRGFQDLAEATSHTLGEPLPSPLMSQRGDVVLFMTEEGPALGIVSLTGMHIACVGIDGSVTRRPLSDALTGWRV